MASTRPELAQRAWECVGGIIAPFREQFPVRAFGRRELEALRRELARRGADELAGSLSLRGYGNVRNLQLLVPWLEGAEVVIALDDDEVVEPDYVARAVALVSERVPGIAGPYLYRGSPFLPEAPETGNVFLDKARIMNEAVRRLCEAPSHPVPTPLAFGGNMVFHRELIAAVPFDPAITRGEDIDYVLNARLAGKGFFFTPELTITHLPPDEYQLPAYAKLRQDVFRFVYEREKLRLAGEMGMEPLAPEELEPYPGRFLREDLEEQALVALEALATPELEALYGTPQEIVEDALRYAQTNAPRYFAFAKMWVEETTKTRRHQEL